jgi:LmbE family N-acetylglucosaminyl deacetylase
MEPIAGTSRCSRWKPDHYRGDLHQDHRTISELTWNTFRNHNILEYEIVKYDGDLGAPNLFVSLDENDVRRKCRMIIENFRTEAQRSWFSEETFRSLMKLRGVESNAPAGYAEAFYCRKIVLEM